MKLSKLLMGLGVLCLLLAFLWTGLSAFTRFGGLRGILPMKNGPMFVTFAVGFIAFLLIAASLMFRNPSRRRPVKKAVDAEAKILSISETGSRINTNPVVDLSLEVRPYDQPSFVGRAHHLVSVVHVPSYQPGKLVRVKYVPGSDEITVLGPIAE